jgi:hypothetical protein
VLVGALELQPSAKAKRLVFTNNNVRVIDGPFSESKDLIGGFAVMDLPDMDQVITMCREYTEILGGTLEIDVRLSIRPMPRNTLDDSLSEGFAWLGPSRILLACNGLSAPSSVGRWRCWF